MRIRTTVTTIAQPGFVGRLPKYRTAWSEDLEIWNPSTDARCKGYRILKRKGLAGVTYETRRAADKPVVGTSTVCEGDLLWTD